MSDKSREELEERVDELEATVKKMLPSRRQVLKGSATAAGAGMLGFSAGNASAQASENDSDGNVGTDSNRVDVFGDGGDFNVVSTGELSIQNRITVGPGDNIQTAIDGLTEDTEIQLVGEYQEISSPPLTFPNDYRVRLSGGGSATTLHNPATDGSHAIVADHDPDTGIDAGVQIANLRLTGDSDSGDGIRLVSCDLPMISHVVIDGVGGHGVSLEYVGGTPGDGNHNIIGTTIDRCGGDGIHLENEVHDILVTNTDIENYGGYGIYAVGDIYNLGVTGSNIEDGTNDPIYLDSTAEYQTFGDNQIESDGDNCITIKNALNLAITGNNMRAATRGIALDGPATDVTIGNNTIRDADYAIVGLDTGLNNISITGNIISDDGVLTQTGITVRGDGIVVSDNIIAASGIGVNSHDGPTNVTVSDNIIKVDPSGSGYSNGSGIVVDAITSASIHDNTVASLNGGTPNYGVYFEASPNSGITHDNILLDCATGIGGSLDAETAQHDNLT